MLNGVAHIGIASAAASKIGVSKLSRFEIVCSTRD